MAEQKHRGPMGGGPRGMMPGEKAKDFKGTMGKLISYLGKYLPAIIAPSCLTASSPSSRAPAASTLRLWPASCSSLALYIWSQPCCLISRALS